MLIKQCQFPGRDERGEYVHVLHPGYDNDQLVKTAAASPPQIELIQKHLKHMDRDDRVLHVLVSAMGAGEYWGSNSNGDYFPEEALIHVPKGWDDMGYEVQRRVGPRWEWGYPTFYNAHAYQHHQNKDPARAFGDVEYALWDGPMKRVLLVIGISRDNAKRLGAQGVVDRIENGEFPDVSMGCKVPYDVCTICADWSRITGNPNADLRAHRERPIRGVSTTRHEYCQHLQSELNVIYPDGRKVYMINLHPKFFDLSFVFIGADKTSKVLAKLAHGLCPIREKTTMCKQGCTQCSSTYSIPSAHVGKVWGSEKVAAADYHVDPEDERRIARYFAGKHRTERAQEAIDRIVGPAKVAASYIELTDAPYPQVPHEEQGRITGTERDRVEKAKTDAKKGKIPGRGVMTSHLLTQAQDDPPAQKTAGFKPDEDFVLAAGFLGMEKAAERRMDIAKKAAIIKRIQSTFSRELPSLTGGEPDIPPEVLDKMKESPRDSLSTAGSMGIVAKPREFQRIILCHHGKDDLADELDKHGLVFRTGGPPDPSFRLSGSIIPRILEALLPLMMGRSLFGPALHKRIVIRIQGPRRDDCGEGVAEKLKDILSSSPIMDKLSSAYSGYRQQLLYKSAALIDRAVHEYPEVSASILSDKDLGSLAGGIVKEGGDVVESLIGMLPTAYLNNAHLEAPVSAYVSERCDLEGLREAGELASCGRVA